MNHHRKPSDASSSSSLDSRPSTSSRSDMSVDWDPLRLHPPQARGLAPLLPAPLPREVARPSSSSSSSRWHQPRELRQIRSSHNLKGDARRQPMQHTYQPSNTIIYGGFDFGFDATDATASSSRRREPSPSPSIASSVSSNCSISGSDEEISAMMAGGLAPAPAPRPRPRPRHQDGTGLDNGAEYFIRRGGWKRRGIVFDAGTPLAGEDETFEI